MDDTIMEEDAHPQRKRILALATLAAIIGFGAYLATGYVARGGSLSLNFSDITPVTLFLAAAIGGLFFVPVPIEATFYAGIRAGSPAILSTVAVITGFMLGNIVSYLVGWKTSRWANALVPAKKLHTMRRYVKKYGVYAIIGVNLIPAPSPLLTFGLGIARYPLTRLFAFLLLANIAKFAVILKFI